ncbi:hypothetical protein KXV81_004633 [Aspergillus fumigatus]|nr:hypothetical protein KXV69_002202 [Aspergillus fumigatus]KAH2345161.1 hypothetical protein KXV29_008585 [Aspergillus fumigatus]KAH3151722.1 hypothetical protein KXV34_002558 [Aspergillus fumigatus]KAH3411533.1 hypothetical protein KXV81_004633 [Aspergillus fumigatus]KAJ8153916.1 hypothetical protein LV155_006330 [Aspergillus fumigatus]
MAEEEDPLIKALPPATDYLTYLTLLEYQLTPARLPTLHKLLQDETLTTNIGWDLVQLLLPMLPQSLECLQDVARLGNPREVILRVSDALMRLQPDEDDSNAHTPPGEFDAPETQSKSTTSYNDRLGEATTTPPRYVVQFNSLVAMLSILHSRIQTKSPSRFLATSLQAVLEAYTTLPTSETTIALLEFLRDVSPTKRPAPPPRSASESGVLRVSAASAPDPEAEVQSPSPKTNDEQALVKRFLQFGLIELLKSYLLGLAGPMDPGMSWAIRLHEKLHPETRLPGKDSQTDVYCSNNYLKDRDMILAKITALSSDFGLSDDQLLAIALQPAKNQPAPLDFDKPPQNVEDIPLERHGSLLLLAGRAAMAELFSSGQVPPIPVFPDLARIYSNFIGPVKSPDDVAFGQPQPLLDSLLTLTTLSLRNNAIGEPTDDKEFYDLLLAVTACTTRQTYSIIRQLPEVIVHSHPSQSTRFKVIRRVLEDEHLLAVKDRAVGWLKKEILAASAQSSNNATNIFLNPHYFSVLFPLLFNSADLLLNVSTDIAASWIQFSQTLAPSIHAALSLYYILLQSSTLRTQLQLEKTYPYFRSRFLEPLKTLCHAFETEMTQNGGDGRIEAAVGEEMSQIGMARSVGLISHVVERVEEALDNAFGGADLESSEPSADDIARVDAIRKETVL